jgi:hypothetical protein
LREQTPVRQVIEREASNAAARVARETAAALGRRAPTVESVVPEFVGSVTNNTAVVQQQVIVQAIAPTTPPGDDPRR